MANDYKPEQHEIKDLTNIDNQDFVGVYGSKEHSAVKAGDTASFPSFLVDHFAKQLAKKILIKKGEDFSDVGRLEELIKQIKGDIAVEEKPEESPKKDGVEEETEKVEEKPAKKTSKKPAKDEFAGKPKNKKK